MKGMEPQQTIFTGEIICDTVVWNPVPIAMDRYTPMSKNEGLVMIRLKQVLKTSVTMKKISNKNILRNKCNKK